VEVLTSVTQTFPKKNASWRKYEVRILFYVLTSFQERIVGIGYRANKSKVGKYMLLHPYIFCSGEFVGDAGMAAVFAIPLKVDGTQLKVDGTQQWGFCSRI
jgi:hypothetical protein